MIRVVGFRDRQSAASAVFVAFAFAALELVLPGTLGFKAFTASIPLRAYACARPF